MDLIIRTWADRGECLKFVLSNYLDMDQHPSENNFDSKSNSWIPKGISLTSLGVIFQNSCKLVTLTLLDFVCCRYNGVLLMRSILEFVMG